MEASPQAQIPKVACSRIQQVLNYIHQNLNQPLMLEDIAKHSCWSRWQLQRVFKQQTGGSVASYVREIKLNEAARRLTDSPDRVIDIALALGFSSEICFSRAFKQMHGVSPSIYRKHLSQVS